MIKIGSFYMRYFIHLVLLRVLDVLLATWAIFSHNIPFLGCSDTVHVSAHSHIVHIALYHLSFYLRMYSIPYILDKYIYARLSFRCLVLILFLVFFLHLTFCHPQYHQLKPLAR